MDSRRAEGLRQRIAALAGMSERGDAYAFVGRKAELARANHVAGNLPPTGSPGNTLVLSGAPGAGKTALANRMLLDMLSADGSMGLMMLSAKGGRGLSSEDLWQRTARLLVTQDNRDIRSALGRLKVGLGLSGALSELAKAHFEVSLQPKLRRSMPMDAVGVASEIRRKGATRFTRLAIFIDEIQEIRPDSAIADFLGDLHLQSSLPILTICAGLGDSDLALRAAGLSRLVRRNFLRIGKLDDGEGRLSAQTVLGGLQRMGLGGGDRLVGDLCDEIGKLSHDWPSHLHVYLNEVFLALNRSGQLSLVEIDLDDCLQRGDAARLSYYEERVDASGEIDDFCLALHHAVRVDGCTSSQCKRHIKCLLNEGGDSVSDDVLQEKFRRLLNAGVIDRDALLRCVVAIPSLTAHLERQCNK